MSWERCSASICCFTAPDGWRSPWGCARIADISVRDLEHCTSKWVSSFGGERTEGRGEMKNLLGGKGANLAEMSSLGLPVPPGFTITTEACAHFYANERRYPESLRG